MKNKYQMFTDKQITPEEFAELMDLVGWGAKQDYDLREIKKSIESYTFVAHFRDDNHQLVGYVSSFSDGAFSTFIGELVIHPAHQGKGLGSELLNAVEEKFKGVPVYAKPFGDKKEFFIHHGYSEPKRPMHVVSKQNKT
jgi:GNAT superfamily N-acetyltransferase